MDDVAIGRAEATARLAGSTIAVPELQTIGCTIAGIHNLRSIVADGFVVELAAVQHGLSAREETEEIEPAL